MYCTCICKKVIGSFYMVKHIINKKETTTTFVSDTDNHRNHDK